VNAKQQEIARLLRKGLDAYGEDDAEAAVYAWNAVLALDPNNSDARDYIDSIGVAAEEPEVAPVPVAEGSGAGPLDEVIALLEQGREVDAHARLLASAADVAPDLETLAVVDLVRAKLLPIYRAGFGRDAMPRAAGDAAQLEALCLTEAACAVHRACNGATLLAALPAASGLDAFDTFHHLSVLVDAGLVSVYA